MSADSLVNAVCSVMILFAVGVMISACSGIKEAGIHSDPDPPCRAPVGCGAGSNECQGGPATCGISAKDQDDLVPAIYYHPY